MNAIVYLHGYGSSGQSGTVAYMEAHMFDNITDEDKNHCWGFFGDEDTTVNCRKEFEPQFFPNFFEFHGGHRMNNAIIRDVLLPFIQAVGI